MREKRVIAHGQYWILKMCLSLSLSLTLTLTFFLRLYLSLSLSLWGLCFCGPKLWLKELAEQVLYVPSKLFWGLDTWYGKKKCMVICKQGNQFFVYNHCYLVLSGKISIQIHSSSRLYILADNRNFAHNIFVMHPFSPPPKSFNYFYMSL